MFSIYSIIILLILAPIFSLPGLFLIRFLKPFFEKVGVWISSAILSVLFLLLYALILFLLGYVILSFSDVMNYTLQQSLSVGTVSGIILGYFLAFFVGSFFWLFRTPSFHKYVGFFSLLFFGFTWILPFVFIYLLDYMYLSGYSLRFLGSREGWGYVAIGFIMTLPLGLIVGPVISIILKNFIPPPFSGQQSQISGRSEISQNFLFRHLESFSLFTKIGILLSAYSIIIAFIDEFSYNWTIRLLNPSYWVAVTTPIPESFPLVQIIALTFLVIVFWKRFGAGRFLSNRSRILAALGAIVVYVLFVFLLFFLLGGFIQF